MGITRRTFLKGTAAASLSAGLMLHEDAWAKEEPKGEMKKRILGRTGLEVTDVSFGGVQITQPRLLDVAIDRGINLVHTSPGFGVCRIAGSPSNIGISVF